MKTRSILRLALLLAATTFTAIDGRADSVTLNLSTSLLDGTTFSTGTTYYAVFQLVGGGTDNNIATLSNFSFTGGSILARDLSDPTSGNFTAGPDAANVSGLGQSNSTLQLSISPGDAFSLYSQRIVAGTSFSFDFLLTNNFVAGNSFDAFTFQLYDVDLGTLLLEQQFDINGATQPVPEPAALLLFGSGLSGAAAILRRRRNAKAR
ncbi:MAG: PEP-CTERM sorting domain-containing protein [Pyrinomonadaceae bacterium]|nr:PEP-CTERM sorting domain-containing protein [Pyrinomonadaceae bacterium]